MNKEIEKDNNFKYKNVAVILRTKDRPLFLERALKDIFSQTYQNFEVIIVNDSGDINILELVIKDFMNSGKIRVVNNKECEGFAKSSNIGINNSKSDFIVIHDDDDTWDVRFLEKTVSVLNKPNINNEYPMGVATHIIKIIEGLNEENSDIKEISREEYNMTIQYVNLFYMLGQNQFAPISFLYRRDVLKIVGYYNEELPTMDDWDFNQRFLLYYDILLIKEPLAYYHVRLSEDPKYANSVTVNKQKMKNLNNFIKNKYLREDIKNEKLGIGYLMNISQNIIEIQRSLNRIENYLKKEDLLNK